MPVSRRRRILRWTLIAAVTPVLLLVSYVSAWVGVSRAIESGLLKPSLASDMRPVFDPILSYCRSGRTGSRTLHDLWWAVVSVDSVEIAGARIRSVREAAPLQPDIPLRLLLRRPPPSN